MLKPGEKSTVKLFGGKTIIPCGQDHSGPFYPQTKYIATILRPARRARSVILRISDL